MPRASEFASYVFIKNDLSNLSWNTRNPNRNPDGQLYTQQECLDNPEIAAGLGRQKPEYVIKVKEDAFWVVEAKNTLDKIDVAYREAIDYAKDINKSDAVKAHIVTGVAGNDDDGYLVQTGVFTPAGKVEIVEYNNKDISHIPTSRRGLLTGKTDNGIHLACLHFGLFEYERRRQVRSLLNFINDETDPSAPLIIAGDFNDWRKLGHKKISRESNLKEAFIEKRQCLARSFPARLPLLMMDRIYFRNMTLVDAEQLSGPPWNRLSDHCALYAEFSLDDR